jgi:RNA polymerase sigma factor (sigma-70 family)
MYDVDAVNVSEAMLSLAELDDGELLALTRSGHQEAYAALFQRYSYAALRLARHLGQKEESDDVVSESFAQVLGLLNRGKGPNEAFRAYLFTTVRHECARRAKARQRVMPTDDLQKIDAPVEFGDGRLDDFERSAVRAAYESLPPRWRTVLWHLDVEGRKPHELGPLLDLSPNSVSALVYRARSGLREAYLQQHVKDDDQAGSRCMEHRAKLSAFVRRTASARDQEKILSHLQSCEACMAIYLDLKDVNREVGSSSVAVTSTVAVSGLAAVTVLGGGLMAALTNVAVVTKGVAAALVSTAAAAAITTATLVSPGGQTALAEPPRTSVAVAATPVAQDRVAATDPAATVPLPSPAVVTPALPARADRVPAARPAPARAQRPAAAPSPAPARPAPAPAKASPAPSAPAPAPAAAPAPSPVLGLPAAIAEPVRAAGAVVADVVDLATRDLGLTP